MSVPCRPRKPAKPSNGQALEDGRRVPASADPIADRRRSAQVPGQYLGYSVQTSRLLDHLIGARTGTSVSLEVVGDTGVEYPDGTLLTEEAKSRTSSSNPIADHAAGLWKTIRNWIDAVQAGQIDPRTTRFRIWVSQPFQGDIAEQFAAATTREAALAALTAARERLLPNARGSRGHAEGADVPRVSAVDVPAAAARGVSHLQAVFTADPELVATIILNFEIARGSGRSLDDLEAALDATFVPPEIATDVLQQALGWLKLHTDAQIEQHQPARVSWEEFRTVVTTIVRRLDRRDFLASVASEPAEARVDEHLRARTYVRQLTLIEVDDDDRIRAVTDYIKAEADRVDWADRGRVLETSFEAFEKELMASWRNYKRRCDIAHKSASDVERGQVLYTDCFDHSSKLDGADLPEHFCRGSFHKLADGRAIGWHPKFASLLAEPATRGNGANLGPGSEPKIAPSASASVPPTGIAVAPVSEWDRGRSVRPPPAEKAGRSERRARRPDAGAE